MAQYEYNGKCLQNKRNANMDGILLKTKEIMGKTVLLAVVCDGVGSLNYGAFAASQAVRMLGDWLDALTTSERLGLKLRDAVSDISRQICQMADFYDVQTASTLSALALIDNQYFIVHVGDSRIYSCGYDGLHQLTTDDISSLGKLTTYMGQPHELIPQYDEGSAQGKLFLLCSDGLYRHMDPNFLVQELNTLYRQKTEKVMNRLIQHVITRGECDNISIVIVKTKS